MFGADPPAGRMSQRERMLQKRRMEEAKVEDLTRYRREMSVMESQNQAGPKAAGAIRRNVSAQRATELMFAKMEDEAATTAHRRRRQNAQDTALAEELATRKAAEESRRLEVQRICEEDPGLRELQLKLKTAYVTAERARQMEEAKAVSGLEAERTAALDAQQEHDRIMGLREEAAREERRRLQGLEGRRVIEDQMIDKERRKFYEGQEAARRDKEAIDAIISKIAEEDRSDREAIATKRAETQKFIKDFQKKKADWDAEKARAEREEEEAIAAYAKAKEDREAAEEARKAAEQAEKDRMYRQIAGRQNELAKQMEEEENLRMLLAEEETQMRVAAEAAAREAKKRSDLADMMAANEAQKRLKAELLEKQRLEEEEFIAMLRRKYAADEASEQAEKDRRARMRDDYKAEVERQKAERAAMFEMQRQAELRAESVSKEREDFRARVVAEARRKLLQEHAALLKDYLPKGVIMDDEELRFIMRFDKNQDGKLDASEVEAAKDHFMSYDDGDGKLDEAEKAAAWRGLKGAGGE